jgi:hypothetical protein
MFPYVSLERHIQLLPFPQLYSFDFTYFFRNYFGEKSQILLIKYFSYFLIQSNNIGIIVDNYYL